jgi:hypothetical protein
LLTPPYEKALVFSGLLVDIKGDWFYVTAGHIIKDVQKSLEAGGTFDIWRFDDQTASNRFNGMAIPYSFEIEDWIVLEDSETGLDYAALPLRDLYRQGLMAGDASPIGRAVWGNHIAEYDFRALVGIPSEFVEYDKETIITARFVIAPITPIKRPTSTQKKSQNLFYSKLADGSEPIFKDVDGMSGGPIFALKKVDGIWMYWLIGMQSAWYPESKILVACPFSFFGQMLEEVVNTL